ncbi:MAG: polymer-forming cytoskeletal protein [Hyphomicrobium sp.]
MFNRVATPDVRAAEPAKTLSPQAPSIQSMAPSKTPAPPLFGAPLQQHSGPMIDAPTSVLGQDITISGQQLVIKTKGSLLIAGHIQGDVHGEAVTVGETGSVAGTITARTITVQGEVSGALWGSSVNLNATSRVDGDIIKQTLSIDEGAQFDGSVRRAKDPSEVTPDLS